MGYGAAKGRFCRSVGVDMDKLAIQCTVSKYIDLLLCNMKPICGLANMANILFDFRFFNYLGHALFLYSSGLVGMVITRNIINMNNQSVPS